jgi:hypothetical protein
MRQEAGLCSKKRKYATGSTLVISQRRVATTSARQEFDRASILSFKFHEKTLGLLKLNEYLTKSQGILTSMQIFKRAVNKTRLFCRRNRLRIILIFFFKYKLFFSLTT